MGVQLFTYLKAGGFFFVIIAILMLPQYFKITKLKKDLKLSQEMANDAIIDKNRCNDTLFNQNRLIEQFRADNKVLEDKHKKEIENLTMRLNDRKVEIIEVLKKDPSCENQLKLIEEDQRKFLS